MKMLVLALSLLGTSALHADQCAQIKPSPNYKLTQVYFTYGTDFSIARKGKTVGKIVERKFNLGRTFELIDEKGNLVARAEKRLVSWGTKIDIYDCSRVKIGSVEQHVFQSLFRHYSVYSILNAKGELVAQSTKWEIIRTSINFVDAQGRTQGRLVKALINVFRDTWNAEFEPNSTIDQRLLLFAAAYKTSEDDNRAPDEDPLGSKN